jgi:4-hydroxy-tetrahydrodipicolinate synthase
MAIEGILTVTVTPFDRSGEVDLDAYGRILDHVIAKGVHYVIPCGTTGEYFALTPDERRKVMDFVAKEAKGKVKLWAGTNATNTREVISYSRYAKELGYQGLMLAAPYYGLPTQAEHIRHFEEVAKSVGLPIMLYNFPARTGVDMDIPFLEGVRHVKEIVAIKESSGSIAKLHDLILHFEDRLEIVCGGDDQALEYFLWGSRSWVAGASNFLPAEHVALYQAAVVERDFEKGLKVMRKLLPILVFMELGGKYLQCCKYGCELAGVPVGNTRAPLLPLSDEEKAAFRKVYEKAVI